MITAITLFSIGTGYLAGWYLNRAQFKQVVNIERKFGSASYYQHIKADGKDYLFTEKELRTAEQRARENREDY